MINISKKLYHYSKTNICFSIKEPMLNYLSKEDISQTQHFINQTHL